MLAWLLEYWKLLALLINSAFIFVVWAMSKTFAKKEDFTHLEKTVESLKSVVKTVPTSADLHSVELQMKEMQGEFGGVKKLLSRVSYQLDMLVENEIKGSK